MTFFRFPWAGRNIYSQWTWKLSSKKEVYLTFDDGPTEELTPWILELLQSKNIKANFFCVGANAKALPHLMEKMRQADHVIGNHTMNHENGSKVSKDVYLNSVEEAAPYTSHQLFRPPYGKLPISYSKELTSDYRVVMWTWLSYDYDNKVSISKILKSADSIQPGDILVLHDNVKVKDRLKELLPALIDMIEKKGYQFGLISA